MHWRRGLLDTVCWQGKFVDLTLEQTKQMVNKFYNKCIKIKLHGVLCDPDIYNS